MTTQTPTAPDYPLHRPDELSAEAHYLYTLLRAHGPSSSAQRVAEENPQHLEELTTAGLAAANWKGELVKTQVSKHYARATGDGDVLVVIREANLDFPRKGTCWP